MEELRGRAAVVIGGGSGIGRGIALALAEAGARVAVADIELESARSVAAELCESGAHAFAAHVDATGRDSLGALAALAARELGDLHLLCNNVGIHMDRALDSCSDRDWAWGLELNLMSSVRAVDVFLPRLRAHGGEAHIVNTASMAALVAQGIDSVPVHLGIYTATKHALLGYSEILRSELAAEGIGVSVLCPGMVRSNLAATSARNRPERFGGPLPEPGPVPEAILKLAMSQEALGPIVVRGIRANRLHILTHAERRTQVEERQRRLLEDFDFAADE